MPPELETPRLILRQWRDGDADALAAMNADPEVMRYYPAPLSRDESDAALASMRETWRRDGISFWAVASKDGELIGFCGLNRIYRPPHLAGGVKIGWRLSRSAWGKGFATEAARASLGYGFADMGLEEIISVTVAANARSCAVMQRLGMHHDPVSDFHGRDETPGSLLKSLAVYRLHRDEWERGHV